MSVGLLKPRFKDALALETLEYAPNAAHTWYLMAGYCYHVLGKPIVSEACMDVLKSNVVATWDQITDKMKYLDLSDIKKEENFDSISDNLKATCNTHVRSVYEGVSMPNPMADREARIRLEARVVIPTKTREGLSKNSWTELERAAINMGFQVYADTIFYASDQSTAKLSASMYRLMDMLKTAKIPIQSYTLHDVLIDSANEDVWSFKHFQETQKKQERVLH